MVHTRARARHTQTGIFLSVYTLTYTNTHTHTRRHTQKDKPSDNSHTHKYQSAREHSQKYKPSDNTHTHKYQSAREHSQKVRTNTRPYKQHTHITYTLHTRISYHNTHRDSLEQLIEKRNGMAVQLVCYTIKSKLCRYLLAFVCVCVLEIKGRGCMFVCECAYVCVYVGGCV